MRPIEQLEAAIARGESVTFADGQVVTTPDDLRQGYEARSPQPIKTGLTLRQELSLQSDDELKQTAQEYKVKGADGLSREDLITAILTKAGYSGDALLPPAA